MLRSLFGAFPAFPTRANTPFTPETLFDGLGGGGGGLLLLSSTDPYSKSFLL